MVKVFALLPRRSDVSHEYFHEHWAGIHADLAKRIKTMRSYVQSHRTAAEVVALASAPYEGIAEVRFDDAATAAGMGEDPNYLEGCHVDEPLFIDTARLGFLTTTEHVLREGTGQAGGSKVMMLVSRADGLAPEDFATRAVDALPALAKAAPGAERLSISVALPESYADGAQPSCDAVLEIACGPGEDAGAVLGPAVLAALEGIADPFGSCALIAEELHVVGPGVPA